jgi:hypothetical protein
MIASRHDQTRWIGHDAPNHGVWYELIEASAIEQPNAEQVEVERVAAAYRRRA